MQHPLDIQMSLDAVAVFAYNYSFIGLVSLVSILNNLVTCD